MADKEKNDKGLAYFRTMVAGLKVVVGNIEAGEVAPPTVQFSQYREKFEGDNVRVGYLATDNEVAIDKLRADHQVEEIDSDDYAKATDPDVNPKVIKLAV